MLRRRVGSMDKARGRRDYVSRADIISGRANVPRDKRRRRVITPRGSYPLDIVMNTARRTCKVLKAILSETDGWLVVHRLLSASAVKSLSASSRDPLCYQRRALARCRARNVDAPNRGLRASALGTKGATSIYRAYRSSQSLCGTAAILRYSYLDTGESTSSRPRANRG